MGFGQDKDKLVVITDGSKRMKLVAFWRDEIPSDAQQVAGYDKRIAGCTRLHVVLEHQQSGYSLSSLL
ncbi:hypothetical protein NXX77_00010 [Phocaeicola dorei]|nr:hypothetical protein [Phocaeicola dorei]